MRWLGGLGMFGGVQWAAGPSGFEVPREGRRMPRSASFRGLVSRPMSGESLRQEGGGRVHRIGSGCPVRSLRWMVPFLEVSGLSVRCVRRSCCSGLCRACRGCCALVIIVLDGYSSSSAEAESPYEVRYLVVVGQPPYLSKMPELSRVSSGNGAGLHNTGPCLRRPSSEAE